MPETRVVVPGDEIGTVEMFEAGEGTYVTPDGKVRAAVYGRLVADPRELRAQVRPLHPPNVLRNGDIVYASIYDIKTGLALAFVEKVEGRDRALAQDNFAAIQISDIADHYVEEISREFKSSDFVRTRVTMVEPTLRLSTAAPDLGVVKAFCTHCRRPLELSRRQRGTLYCNYCKRGESRKLSTWYGKVRL